MQVKEIKQKIEELEKELDGLDYGSYSYDVVDMQLQFLEASLWKMENK
jgi:hypothetical protein